MTTQKEWHRVTITTTYNIEVDPGTLEAVVAEWRDHNTDQNWINKYCTDMVESDITVIRNPDIPQ